MNLRTLKAVSTWMVFIVFVVGAFYSHHAHRFKKVPIKPERVSEELGGKWEEQRGRFRYFKKNGGKFYSFMTDEIPPEVRGYCSEIGVLVEVDKKGKIVEAKPLRYCETPYYFEIVKDSGTFEKLKGQKITGKIRLDAVTGATVSSRAVKRDVEKSGMKFAKEVLKLKVEDGGAWSIDVKQVLLIFSVILGIIPFLLRKKRVYAGVQAVNFILLGVVLSLPVTIGTAGEVARGGLVFTSSATILAILAFLIAIFNRNIYCRTICPFGNLIDLGRYAVKKSLHVPFSDAAGAVILRNLLATLTIVFLLLLDDRRAGFVEPFAWLFSRALFGWFAVIYGAFTFTISVISPRFWCNFLCPTGALLTSVESVGSALRRGLKKAFPGVLLCAVISPFTSSCVAPKGYQINLAYYAEFISSRELESLLPVLSARQVSIHLAVPSSEIGDPQLAEFFREAERENVKVYFWLTLPYKYGYWINESNIDLACERFDEAGMWIEDEGLGIDGFVFDMESPYQFAEYFQQGLTGMAKALNALWHQLDPVRFTNSRDKLESCVGMLKQNFNLPVYAVTYPFVLDDLEAGGEGFQDLFDIPVAGVPFDEVGFMVYTSFMRDQGITAHEGYVYEYARRAVRFYGEKAAIGLGVVGPSGIGVKGNLNSLDELYREENCAIRAGVKRIRVYSVAGPLMDQTGNFDPWFSLPSPESTHTSCSMSAGEKALREASLTLTKLLEDMRWQ